MGSYLCDGEIILEVGAIRMKLRSAHEEAKSVVCLLLLKKTVGEFVKRPGITVDLIVAAGEVLDRASAVVSLVGESSGHGVCYIIAGHNHEKLLHILEGVRIAVEIGCLRCTFECGHECIVDGKRVVEASEACLRIPYAVERESAQGPKRNITWMFLEQRIEQS